MFRSDYYVLFKRLGFALCLFVLSRIGFYFYNFDYFQAAEFSETLWAFLIGLRFDLATVLIANLIFIIPSIIPFRSLFYEKALKWLFVICNTVFLGFIIGDFEFFAFNGKKLTLDLFMMGADIKDQSFQLMFNYWYLSGLMALTSFVLWRFYPKKGGTSSKRVVWFKAIPVSLLIFVLTAIGVRGGLQLRSISPKEAFVFKTYELGNFALNSAYSLVRSLGSEGTPVARYFASDDEALGKLLESRDYGQGSIGVSGQNVVVVIVESLSQEYIEEGYAPFVRELAAQGLYFDHNFANGRRSMEALPSIMASFPSIIGAPLYQTQYQSNKFYPLPRILKEHGYATAFYHGGKRGTMDFDAYCYSIGFDEYHALEDYPNQEHFDGHWGVYDHHYLSHFADKLEGYKEPFFTGVFTLSSHQPYSIPAELKGNFPKGTLPIHESIGYADYSLRKFFEKVKDKPWYKNTLFVVTADHTQKLATKEFNSMLGRYRVPLIFFHPGRELKASAKKEITQHVDILPSVLDFLDIDYPQKLYFGTSVFNDDPGMMLNYNSGSHFMLRGNSLVSFDGRNVKAFETDEKLLSVKPASEGKKELLEVLKAIIQYTNNGLRNNNIYSLKP